jgi:protein tyrosine phosphatase (PTP) superfamily phosphohydrolase (DUF442 family)
MRAQFASHIENYLEISDQLGTGGQPRREDFAALAADGYEVVINLAMPGTGDGLPEEDWLVTELGMLYVHLPVVWEAPDPAMLAHFCDVMDLYSDNKVFVHCIKNMRVAAFVFVYRVCRRGVDRVEAEIDLHRIWHPHGVWRRLVETALATCEERRQEVV